VTDVSKIQEKINKKKIHNSKKFKIAYGNYVAGAIEKRKK